MTPLQRAPDGTRQVTWHEPLCTAQEARDLFEQVGPLGTLEYRDKRRKGNGALIPAASLLGSVLFKGRRAKACRVVWLIHTGAWPRGKAYYRNNIRADIRFANLLFAGEPNVSDLV